MIKIIQKLLIYTIVFHVIINIYLFNKIIIIFNNIMSNKDCPKWEPKFWNNLTEADLKITNCYSYAFNYIEKNKDPKNNILKVQPGEICDSKLKNTNCSNIIKNINCDNNIILKKTSFTAPLLSNEYRIALVLDKKGSKKDYHFYRQDCDGSWSHKQGKGKVKRYDASNKLITNPEIADRNYSKKGGGDTYNYEKFCGFFAVPYNGRPSYRN
jgi:hypothetical protein